MNNGKNGAGDSCSENDANPVIPAYENGEQVGTYRLQVTTGADGEKKVTVLFTPNPDYTGTPDPAILTVKNKQTSPRQHNAATAKYTPHTGSLTATDAETWGKKGESQDSDDSNTGTVGFTAEGVEITDIDIYNPDTDSFEPATPGKKVPALDASGNKIGEYEVAEVDKVTGKVRIIFRPDPDFVGDPQPARIRATASDNSTAEAKYQPHVTSVNPPTGTDAETWGPKGRQQNSDDSVTTLGFKKGDGKFVSIQFVDPYSVNPYDKTKRNLGKTTDKLTIDALDKNGKKIGTYTLKISDLANGKINVVFNPNKDFVGDPQPCLIRAVDEYGLSVTILYQPHVKDDKKPSGGGSSEEPPSLPKAIAEEVINILPPPIAEVITGDGSSTGDSSHMLFWGGTGVAALLLFLVILFRRRRRFE